MKASYVLTVQGPSGGSQVREFDAPRIVIGRESGDLVVPDGRCSSSHAEVLFDGARVRVRDLGSTNGTLVNGARVDDLDWTPGTMLQIGAHTLTLREIRAAQGGAKGRTVAGNVVLTPPPGAPIGFAATALAQAAPPAQGHAPPAYGPGPQGGYGPPPSPHAYGAPGHAPAASGYGAPPPTGPAAGFGPPPKKKGMSPWLIAIPLVLLGTCGVGGALVWKATKVTLTGGGGGPVLTEPREAKVDFVWFAGEPGPSAKGGTAPARVRIGPNKSGTVSVGVSEEFAGGGGNQWRTATWLAAFNATRTTGGTLSDYEFNVQVGGHVDGPSAGMLTTATMLALLRGKDVLPGTTMTGTINPDGTAGPVGGIVQKMEGAKATGLKRFGFPLGSRQHKDMKTGKMVDLVSVGQDLGLEVKEITDVYEGYNFLTGDTLPRATPLGEADLEPSAESQAMLRTKLAAWKARIDREIGQLKAELQRSGTAAQAISPMIAEADKSFAKAQQYEKNGYLVPAFDAYANTAIQVAAATRLTSAVFHIQRRNLKALMEAVQTASSVKPEVEAYGDQLVLQAAGKTRGGQISTTSAFTHYVVARSATMIGDDFLSGAVEMLKAFEAGKLKLNDQSYAVLVQRVTAPTLYYDVARVYLEYAKDAQSLIADEGTAPPLDATTIDRTVKGYASASSAVYAYFDALITDEVAKETGKSGEEAQALIANREPDYYLGRKANALSEYSGSETKDGAKLLRLAAASHAYLNGAKLVNKWYSLSASFDKEGNLVLENRRALSAQLDLARQTARESAARAKQVTGIVPAPARFAYQVGSAHREGTDDEKLEALAAYWQSSFWSELAATGGER